jgi:hypothetical protein
MYQCRLASKYYENFLRIIHSYNIIHQKDMMNFEDKISRKSVLLNIKKQLIQLTIVVFEEAAIPCRCAVWLGNLFSRFRKKYRRHLQD